jgi:DNA replication protein DnaC
LAWIDPAQTPLKVISQRYAQGSILLTTSQPYKHWPKIFNNDSTLTRAVLDRLLYNAHLCLWERALAANSALDKATAIPGGDSDAASG